MEDELVLTHTVDPQPTDPKMLIRPWMVFTVSLIAIGGLVGVTAWILGAGPTEGERSQILAIWQAAAWMAFGFFLGSSVGGRNAVAKQEVQI